MTLQASSARRPAPRRATWHHAERSIAARILTALLLAAPLIQPVRSATSEDGAAPPQTSAPQASIETVEVRGATEASAQAPTAFATVIRAQDFADRITSLGELLREAVGLQVKSLGGEFATVSIRGSTAEQVIVYLDGVPLNRALGGGVNLADLPLAQVESIEIVRGFTPASLPAASIGGAVLIHSRLPDGRKAGSASVSYGSFGTAEAVASLAGSRGRSDYALGFDATSSRGDFRYLDDNATAFTATDDETARRANNDFRRFHLSGRSLIRAGERGRITLSADLVSGDQGVPGIGAYRSKSARFDSTRALGRADLEAPGLLSGRLLVRGAVDYSAYSETFDDPHAELGLAARTNSRIDTFGQELGIVLIPEGHQAISVLAAHSRETADLEDRIFDPPGLGSAARDTIVLTVEDQIALAGGRLLLDPSLRRERYDNGFRPGPSTGLVPDSLMAGETFTTGQVGWRVRASDGLTFKGNLGRFLRLPDFIELFGNRGSILGNPALSPERGTSFDAGFVFSRRPGTFLRQASFEGSLFETLADDLIVLVQIPQAKVKARNFGRARVRGMETSLTLALGPRFTGSLNATHQWAIDVSGDPADGELLPGRPVDEVSAGAALALGRGRLFYQFTYVGKNYVDSFQTESTALPARYLHDLGYRLRLPRGLTATIEVDNLSGRQTYDVARFPLPGRSVRGRLAWEF